MVEGIIWIIIYLVMVIIGLYFAESNKKRGIKFMVIFWRVLTVIYALNLGICIGTLLSLFV